MAVAGLAIRPDRMKEVIAEITAVNREYGVTSEVKWSTAKPRRQDIYRAYIDILFNLINANQAHFHIRFVPMSEYEHSASGKRLFVDTISKQFYQLLLHRPAKRYGGKCIIRVRPDKGDCTSELLFIIDALNREAKSRHRLLFEPFGDVQLVDSRRELMLQLLDVTIGAMCAARNRTHLAGEMAPYKAGLVEYVQEKMRPHSVDKSTGHGDHRLSIWNVRPEH